MKYRVGDVVYFKKFRGYIVAIKWADLKIKYCVFWPNGFTTWHEQSDLSDVES